MRRLEHGPSGEPGPVVRKLVSHSPLVDSLDSVGGIRATVHIAVLSAGKAIGEPDAYRKGDSLLKDCAMRRLREDLPYLLLALSSGSPEGAEARAEAAEGLRILRAGSRDAHACALASRLLAAIGIEDADSIPASIPDNGGIRKAVLAVEAAEAAMAGDMDQFEESRRKIARHRSYDAVEALLPQILLSLEADNGDEWSRRGLSLLRDRVTPLVRPGAVLARLVLEKMAGGPAHDHPPPDHASEASVDLAQ